VVHWEILPVDAVFFGIRQKSRKNWEIGFFAVSPGGEIGLYSENQLADFT
jgi:hypothetical protein